MSRFPRCEEGDLVADVSPNSREVVRAGALAGAVLDSENGQADGYFDVILMFRAEF